MNQIEANRKLFDAEDGGLKDMKKNRPISTQPGIVDAAIVLYLQYCKQHGGVSEKYCGVRNIGKDNKELGDIPAALRRANISMPKKTMTQYQPCNRLARDGFIRRTKPGYFLAI